MNVVVITQQDWDRLWLKLKPQHRMFVEGLPVTSILLNGILVTVGEVMPLETAMRQLAEDDMLQEKEAEAL